MDPAASEIYRDGAYQLEGAARTADDMVAFWAACSTRSPIVSLEDGLAEDDWEGWARLTRGARRARPARGRRHLRHEPRAAASAVCARGSRNAILVKVNQIGTLTETLDVIELAARHALRRRWCRHRSGETEDTTIADLAVATERRADQEPARPSRGERTAKYNQLLRIEEELGENARYAGGSGAGGRGMSTRAAATPRPPPAGPRRAAGASSRCRRASRASCVALLVVVLLAARGRVARSAASLAERAELAELQRQAAELQSRRTTRSRREVDPLNDPPYARAASRASASAWCTPARSRSA